MTEGLGSLAMLTCVRMVTMTIWRWHNHHRNVGVMNSIITNTAKEGAAKCSNPTGTHDYKLGMLIFCQFADHFSWPVVFLLEQLELKLQ